MVEKENNADCKSFQEVAPCITHYDIEKQFQLVYTNKKFEEFQEQLKGKIYCYPSFLRQEGSICTFMIVQDVKIGEQQLSLDFFVSFNGSGCNVRCTCCHFEFRGILCSHIISVLALMKIKQVPSKYVLQRWRKDLKRSHSSIACSYDDNVNTPVAQRFDELCKSFYEVAEMAAPSDELFNLVMDGLRELKVKVKAQRAIHDNQKANPAEHQDVEM
uniref:Protein FAR1-RELATED SEQUENCE n=1 Tax=Arundo donax TaxID=35708 RepID=A0A0A9F4W5_ARUDO